MIGRKENQKLLTSKVVFFFFPWIRHSWKDSCWLDSYYLSVLFVLLCACAPRSWVSPPHRHSRLSTGVNIYVARNAESFTGAAGVPHGTYSAGIVTLLAVLSCFSRFCFGGFLPRVCLRHFYVCRSTSVWFLVFPLIPISLLFSPGVFKVTWYEWPDVIFANKQHFGK